MKQVILIKVFIASPGDVAKQRDEVENLIWDWNNNHTDSKNIILMPIRYETNSSASYRENTSGQAVINEQIVKSSDILIAIFGNKIGTRTENGISGTVEEINVFNEEHGKGAGIFFIEDDNVPYGLMEQRKMVERYKGKLRDNHYGLYQEYSPRNIVHFINKEVNDIVNDSQHNPYNEEKEIEIDLFDNIEFDNDEQLLLIYIIEDSNHKLGIRWMAEETEEKIYQWEEQNNIINYLSSRYVDTVDKLQTKGFLKPMEYTEYGNPRLYSIDNEVYKELKKIVFNNQEKVNKIKETFTKLEDTQVLDYELPF